MAPATAPVLAIVAGESSGDQLGAGLVQALRCRVGALRIIGVGGEALTAAGLEPLAPLSALNVNGISEPLRRLPELLRLLGRLERQILAARPAAFIGIDFNVFNGLLERRLKRRGVPVAHYVSPSVYAWRRGRARRLARAADLLLTLFPFEAAYYADEPLRVSWVGHPLADAIAADAGSAAGRAQARGALGIPGTATCFGLLPGSRPGELRRMAPLMLAAAARLRRWQLDDEGREPWFVTGCPDRTLAAEFTRLARQQPQLQLVVDRGSARRALTAADAALVTSGTATLEALCLRRPMVVCYRLSPLSYALMRPLLRSEHIALPNLLAGRRLVPELLQRHATPTRLAMSLLTELDKARSDPEYLQPFDELHRSLRRHANRSAAAAVADWLGWSAPQRREPPNR